MRGVRARRWCTAPSRWGVRVERTRGRELSNARALEARSEGRGGIGRVGIGCEAGRCSYPAFAPGEVLEVLEAVEALLGALGAQSHTCWHLSRISRIPVATSLRRRPSPRQSRLHALFAQSLLPHALTCYTPIRMLSPTDRDRHETGVRQTGMRQTGMRLAGAAGSAGRQLQNTDTP